MRQCLVVALLLRACSSMRTPQAAVSRRSIGGLAAAGVALRPSLPVLGQRCMRAFELRAVFVDAARLALSTAWEMLRIDGIERHTTREAALFQEHLGDL